MRSTIHITNDASTILSTMISVIIIFEVNLHFTKESNQLQAPQNPNVGCCVGLSQFVESRLVKPP